MNNVALFLGDNKDIQEDVNPEEIEQVTSGVIKAAGNLIVAAIINSAENSTTKQRKGTAADDVSSLM